MECTFCLFELGSTSLKFLYRNSTHGAAGRSGSSIQRFKVPWRVGEEVARDGHISGSSILFALRSFEEVLARFRVECHPREIIAFATGVFREAQNARHFIEIVEKEIGLRIFVLSAEREAALLQALTLSKNFGYPSLVFDLGGGSIQWVSAQTASVCHRGSLRVGVYRVFDLIQDLGYEESHRVVDRLLARFPGVLVRRVVGTGGTARAIRAALGGGAVMPRADLVDLEMKVLRRGPPETLKPHRRPVFLAGLTVVNRIMSSSGAREFVHRDLSVGKGLLLKVLPFYERRAEEMPPVDATPSKILRAIDYAARVSSAAI